MCIRDRSSAGGTDSVIYFRFRLNSCPKFGKVINGWIDGYRSGNGILSGKSESCICGCGRSYLVLSELSGMVSKKIYGEKWEK